MKLALILFLFTFLYAGQDSITLIDFFKSKELINLPHQKRTDLLNRLLEKNSSNIEIENEKGMTPIFWLYIAKTVTHLQKLY